ncbi:MAG: hypothetical protein VX185_02705 [Pseudomonadota bacterium]|nr:hypothetical protein [Pseudomonadota bacterium]
MIQQFVHDIDISHIQYLRHKMVRIQGQGQSSQYPSVDNSKARDLNQTPRVSLQLNTMAAQNASQHLQQVEPRYSESPTEIATVPDDFLNRGEHPPVYKSQLDIDESTYALARDLCHEVQGQMSNTIDFQDLIDLKAESDNADGHPLKETTIKKYHQTDVAEYRDKTNYPSKSLDIKSQRLVLNELCAHGTNVKAIISALMHSNQQLVPGIKSRKLGLDMMSGETNGTSLLNQKFVSTVGLSYLSSTIYHAKSYALRATKVSPLVQKKSQSLADTIPAVALGNGAAEGNVWSSIGNERVFKRFNIHGVAVPKEYIPLMVAIKETLNIFDLQIFDFNAFDKPQSSKPLDGLDLQSMWAKGI